MFWTFMAALWVVMLLAPLALLVALLPAGRDCPRCGGETLLLRSRLLGTVRNRLGRRWCTACGWEGLMRYGAYPAPPALELLQAEPAEADDDALWRGDRDNSLF